MKTPRYLSLSLLVTIFAACSMGSDDGEEVPSVPVESSEVPETIKQAFKAQNPEITADVKWAMKGDVYEAEYLVNGMEHAMIYNKEGVVVESEVQIPTEDLPEVVRDYIVANYREYSIGEAEVDIIKGVVFYEVEISLNGEEKELRFDTLGNLVEEDDEGDEDGDND